MEAMPEINLDTAKKSAKQTVSTLKSAGSLVAKKAEETKIVTVTLPRAYGELGKIIYKNSSRRREFQDLFQVIDGLLADRQRIKEEAESRPTAVTLAEKAKQVASDATAAAKKKAIDLQAFQAFANIGETAFQRFGREAGPAEVIEPIANAVARRNQLVAEMAMLQQKSNAKWLTPKSIVWTIVGVVGLVVLGNLFRTGQKDSTIQAQAAVKAVLRKTPAHQPSQAPTYKKPVVRKGKKDGSKTNNASIQSVAKDPTPQPSQTPTDKKPVVRREERDGSKTNNAAVQSVAKEAPPPPSQTTTDKKRLAADYGAMIRDAKQRTCSEVYCSLERFVGNGTVTPQPGNCDFPLKVLVEDTLHVAMKGYSHEADAFQWDWREGGATQALKRWLEVCGPTTVKPLEAHEPSFSKRDIDNLVWHNGHLGQLYEIPFKCVDGELYIIGCIEEMPPVGKMFSAQKVLLIPSSDSTKRAEGEKVKDRFQLAKEGQGPRRELTDYELGVENGRLVAINASKIVSSIPPGDFRDKELDERASTFWFERVPSFEEQAKHSDFARGYLHGMIDQWKKEGLPNLR